jgi:hypothetical protein
MKQPSAVSRQVRRFGFGGADIGDGEKPHPLAKNAKKMGPRHGLPYLTADS